MLSNINISNLENSKSDSSIYYDACENSIQLEQEYNKKHGLNPNKSNVNINENNNINVNQSVKINLVKILDKDDLNNQNEQKNEINESNVMNYSLFKNNGINMNNPDEKTKETKNKNINNRYIINKNINCKNINKINLSNINIIINNDKENKEKENINSKKIFDNFPKLDINNISNKENESIIEVKNIKNDIKQDENLKKDSTKNVNNESLTKNVNNTKLTDNYNHKKNSLHFSSTSNLDFNSFNDFNNITIITKRKKKGDSNNLSKSTVVNQNNSLSFLSNDNTVMSNKIKFEDISYNQIDLNYLKHLRIIPIKYKKKGKRYLKTLLELQHFYVDSSDIRVIKISENGKFLAVGLENGKIKIFEILGYDYTKYELIYNKNNIMKYLNFMNEKSL